MILEISKSSCIGQCSIQNTLSEYKSQGTISSPPKKIFKPTVINEIGKFGKNAIRKKFIIFGGTVKYQQFK